MKKHLTVCDVCGLDRPTHIEITDDAYAGWSVITISSATGLKSDARQFDLCGSCTFEVQKAMKLNIERRE